MGLSKQVTCSGPYLATKYSKEPLVAKQGPEPRARQTSPVCVFQPLCAVRCHHGCHDPVSGVRQRSRGGCGCTCSVQVIVLLTLQV